MIAAAQAFVVIFGIGIVAVGVWGAFAPEKLQRWIVGFAPTVRIELAVVLRAAFGVSLLVAAPSSNAPLALQALGGVALLAALVLSFIGAGTLHAIAHWWGAKGPAAVRLAAGCAAAFGGFVLFAVA